MLKRLLVAATVALLSIVFVVSPVLALPDAEQWEYYTAGDDSEYEVYGNIWFAQTFTVGNDSHSITEFRYLAYREGSPGTVTVSVRATSATLPTGSDLTSGTANADNYSTASAGVWYSVDLTEYELEAGVQYAIVIRAVAGNATNALHLRYDGSAATFANGSECNSTNGGVSWAADTDDDLLFEVRGRALLEVASAKVFRGYLEDDDLLVVLHHFNVYVPYYPDMIVEQYFDLQLTSADGGTIYASTTCKQWGYMPGSIYLSADSAASLTPGSAYRVYVYGDFGANPEDYYTLQSEDWQGTNFDFLDSWVITTARVLADYYSVDFTTFVSGQGEVLNEEGGIIFLTGIPGLADVRPDIFQVVMHVPTYDATSWDLAFDEGADWEEQLGTDVSLAFTTGGGILGIGGDALGAIIVFVTYLGLAGLVVLKGGSPSVVIALAIPVVLLGVWLKLISVVVMGAIAAVAVLLLVFSFWWART